jgi:hypothetical protein
MVHCRRSEADLEFEGGEAMIDALKEVFDEAARLPEDEQRNIVEIVKKAIAAEKRWQMLLHDPRSEYLLNEMVAEALAEDAAGETEEITGENFLS